MLLAQTLAQEVAQEPAVPLKPVNTHDDIAGVVILHQQYIFSSAVRLVVILSDFAPIPSPFCEEQPQRPLTKTSVPPVEQFATQYEVLLLIWPVHVVEEFNGTHFCAALTGSIDTHTPADMKTIINILFIFYPFTEELP